MGKPLDTILSSLQRHLDSAYKKTVAGRVAGQLLYFLGFLLIGLLLLVQMESVYFFPPIVKSISAGAILLLSGFAAYWLTRNPAKSDREKFVFSYLKTRKKDGEKIQSALDLYKNSDQKKSLFYEAALESNLREIDIPELKEDLTNYLRNTKSIKHASLSLILLLVTLTGFTWTYLSQPEALGRTTALWEAFEKPNPYTYVVTPGSDTVEQGQTITPAIQFSGNRIPETVIFAFKTDVEENFRERPMQLSEDSRFIAREIEATNSLDYRILMDGFQTDLYRLDVEILPRFDQLNALITPPAYTQLPERELRYPFSNIEIFRGSEITFRGQINKTVRSVILYTISDTLTFPESGADSLQTMIATLKPDQPDTVRFEMEDFSGLKSRNQYRTIIDVKEDESPLVVIREPAGTVMMNEPGELDILYQATDDFGLTQTELRWEVHRAYVEEPERQSRQLPVPQNGRNTRFSWDLSELGLSPRDEVRFLIRVKDNDGFANGKWGQSREVVISVPSLADFFDEMDSRERNVQSELDEVSESFDQMEQEYERFMERMRQNPEGGFEEQEMLESVSENQQQIDETVKNLQEQFESLRQEMESSQSVSEETRESYRELQELIEELDDPDLQNALRELREAMENMNPNQMEQALENVSFNEELYKERLERTKELFKKLKMNSDLDKLAKQYENLSERMSSENTDINSEQLDQQMESVQEDMDKLSDQLDKLDDNPPKRSEEQIKELQEQAQSRLEEMKKQMQQMSDQLQQEMQEGQKEPSEQMQQQKQQISEQLQEESENIRNMQQQMSGQQMQVNILALQRALYTLLELSDTQEFLTKDSQETGHRSAGYINLARQQNYVYQQFSSVADSIFQISSEIPGVPNRMNKKKAEVEQSLQKSVDQMAERNQRGAIITSRESLGGINELSSTIASLIDQLMDQSGDSGGGGGMSMQQMIEQMQQMSGQQQQMNQQLQDLVNDMQGNRLSREQSDRLEQLARQQNEIRKQLRELQRSGALRQGDKTLSELQRAIEEMEDSINDMRGGVTDQLMIERQQNILSRMLSAENAMEQRGEEEKREGTSSDPLNYELPPNMTLDELQQEIRSRLQDPNYTRFSEEYQRLIELYFERIQQMNDEVIQ